MQTHMLSPEVKPRFPFSVTAHLAFLDINDPVVGNILSWCLSCWDDQQILFFFNLEAGDQTQVPVFVWQGF